jgi:Protein of unknown function (DUF3618)
MTDTIKELEQDIAQTRARLGDTIDRLQGNLSPSDVADDLIGSGRPDFGNVLDPVMAAIRSHPAPTLLIAVGVGWLVYKMVRGEAEPALRIEDHGRRIQTPQ